METLHYTSCNMVANLMPISSLYFQTRTLSDVIKTLSTLLRGVENIPNYGKTIKMLNQMLGDLDKGKLEQLATDLNSFKNDLIPLTDELTVTAIRIQNYAKKLLMATNVSEPQTVQLLSLAKKCPESQSVKDLCVWEQRQHSVVNRNLMDLQHDISKYDDVHTRNTHSYHHNHYHYHYHYHYHHHHHHHHHHQVVNSLTADMQNIANFAFSEKWYSFLNFVYDMNYQLFPFQDLMQTNITITIRNWLQTRPEPVTKCVQVPLPHSCTLLPHHHHHTMIMARGFHHHYDRHHHHHHLR
jgi:hypothetical protein